MTKPVELIVTAEMHRIAEEVEKSAVLKAASETEQGRRDIVEGLARQILCDIAHQSRIEYVAKALEAVGISGGLEAVRSRYEAAREQRAEERRTLGIPEPTPKGPAVETLVKNFIDKLGKELGPNVKVETVQVKSTEE